MCTTFLNVILQNVQINTLQNVQNVNNAQNAKCKQCTKCKMQTMQRLQNVFIAAAAKCEQCGGQGSARVRLGQGSGSARLGSDRFGSGSLSLSMGRPDDRLADPCQTMRHRFEPACCAARCRSPEFWPDPYRCARNGVRLRSHRPHSRHGVTQSHLKPCPPLTFWACPPLRPALSSSLPRAQLPSYGPLPLRIGSPLISDAKFSSYGSLAIHRLPSAGA